MSGQLQHDLIEKLVDLYAAAVTATVYDGPNLEDTSLDEVVCVGWDPAESDDQVGVLRQEFTEFGGAALRKEETGTLAITVWATSGDKETVGRRRRVRELLEQLEAVHRADPTVGGLVLDSNFASAQRLHQRITSDGNEAFAVVTFDYRARV